MGACICHKPNEYFSMNDISGMEKFYSVMSKRKADICTWLIASEGPWEAPESILCFKQIDAKYSPVKVSNEDEIRIRASNSKSSINVNSTRTSSWQVDRKKKDLNYIKPIDSTLSNATSATVNNGTLLDWPSDW
jgi:hypothetical protein